MSSAANPVFSEARMAEIKALIERYPAPQAVLLPVLHMAQEDFGYLSMEVQQMVADTLALRLMAVREVVTFYTMFREQPCGTYLVEVCTNAGCMLNGANELVAHMCGKLGIKPGETTPDGLFTVTEVECAGACAGAPVVQINNLYHEKVDVAHIDAFIEKARSEGGAA
ncbi:MAG: NAD(P)H-dependent oxidoreductase subunit E [Zetaproteobacteria bacterium CG12_big_fil_rev_8_21_14_0_65_55_1124]|nr:MAG: NAD(P)H-dependent oxidoreductase subunit E [Zetaproteobacteria bacterium CG1_02_55_237]PIS19280.1 MAG: NAD(P)H-dependent oxidoreductase subunit E [Zetaproteobacteria bacterium CG08_land_8_20_14_0_20_55_17]PIW43543.1 MAG: NAD(P)H-dependent oxidoreductase subunit E [Zetaproteobacteria bacterium CG12_big_fil_rev_8_21_14_0_65_55_1124]PIY54403.1 MAG: NAD(P)H-dependent oxidoreductase subunit E [Zetaproteobacteria bacterium CG_4_10_14_0_8_um_filter_55_43]PIZ39006.1 MAG: NAD(P)H-dependent oxido